jgi:hypothetical protein
MFFGILFLILPTLIHAHGFLCSPASRNAAWACGYPKALKNYDLMALNAGGVYRVYPWYPDLREAVWGVCGDPAESDQQHQPHSACGLYDIGPTARFESGSETRVQVNITAYHRGFFEIQLCPTYPEYEACFTTITNFSIHDIVQPSYEIPVTLPPNITCERCVLRWFYTTGNSPGYPPEIFLNCADITIV